jgi:hypothetical protein
MKTLCVSLLLVTSALAANNATPIGEPQLEKPTLRSLGTYWIIRGDDNKNAAVRVDYRKKGESKWRQGPPLFRVEKGKHQPKENESALDVPHDAWLFAGSIVLLERDTLYDIKLTLSDPDGGAATKQLASKTIAEPQIRSGNVRHVIPGTGGGTGTEADPFRGIADANRKAKPGDVFLIHAGEYNPPLHLDRSGEPGKPIVWRGAGDGETIIDAKGGKRAMDTVSGTHDVWFENITFRNATVGLVTHECERIVVRGCKFSDVEHGFIATKNDNDKVNDYFIVDNVFEGRSKWPRSEGIEDRRAIQVTGSGHVVAYNRFRAFGDAIDTMPSQRCEAIDFHNNEIDLMTDDGIEADYAQRNVRVFENRLNNVFQGISVQPVYGGPVYVFRNAMYNVCVEPFKMHNGPSGAIMIHNTSVKKGAPLIMWTSKPISNCVYRNNLFVGSADKYGFEYQGPAEDCDYDYDGIVGGPFDNFMKWNGERYKTIKDVHEKAPIEKHAVHFDTAGVFASGAAVPTNERELSKENPDLRLASGTPAIDAGEKLAGFNDEITGKGPDLGAYELGGELPHYGPRTESRRK